MSAGYVGSISLTQGMISTFDYETAFAVCAIGTVVGALFGTIAACRRDHQVSSTSATVTSARLIKDRRSLLLTVGYMGHCWELFGMWAWAPTFLIASLGNRFALGAVGLGIAIAIALHLSAFFASFSLGRASDRYGRRAVLISVAFVGALCSFGFGWSGELPSIWLLAFAAIYGCAALGDSSVLSTAMSEAVPATFLGRALGTVHGNDDLWFAAMVARLINERATLAELAWPDTVGAGALHRGNGCAAGARSVATRRRNGRRRANGAAPLMRSGRWRPRA